MKDFPSIERSLGDGIVVRTVAPDLFIDLRSRLEPKVFNEGRRRLMDGRVGLSRL